MGTIIGRPIVNGSGSYKRYHISFPCIVFGRSPQSWSIELKLLLSLRVLVCDLFSLRCSAYDKSMMLSMQIYWNLQVSFPRRFYSPTPSSWFYYFETFT